MVTLDAIRGPVAQELEEFDAFVRRNFKVENELLSGMVDYILSSRGKGVRPLLVLLSAALNAPAGGRGIGQRTYLAAMLVEIIHTASLIHDDVIDRYLSSNDEAVLDMLNTRYLILPGADGRPEAHLRATAQGAAWLVRDVVTASTPQQELAALATADLRRQAVVNPADYARMTGAREGALPAVDTLGGTIRLTEYRPNYLKYEYTSAAPATAVFSEIFYDKGWTAWVDGVEIPYFRADYLLRALELPAGDHTVEWRFRAPHWGAVEGVTGLCSAAILLLIAGLAAAEWYKRKKR